ncbi:PQQ-binding-like beta-propeller repeat protein [Streptomyces sp. MNU89]|uniref:outer membrane protein assembly factor BamB family protein n=1 Tax=Streptomyces sp. MNU89 TaxID=2560025 RepID=UPI001E366B62|nr:PQQ-binding-like beta-propeller repeat protein [Streptomyces sp. MNU89]MCC9739123.1 PQQ-like beta-propeller repeat protein [Streptomyces sp. MNU89]
MPRYRRARPPGRGTPAARAAARPSLRAAQPVRAAAGVRRVPAAHHAPPPPGGPGRKRTAVIIGSVLAVLLAVGGTVFAVSGGDDDGGKPSAGAGKKGSGKDGDSAVTDGGGDGDEEAGSRPGDDGLTGSGGEGEGKVLWQKPAPDVPKSGVDTPGFWLADGSAVKAALESVTAYDAGKGKEKWSVELGGTVCASSVNATSDGRVAVAYEGEKKDRCSHLALIDLKKGKKLWDKALPEGGGFGGFIGTTVAVGGDTVGSSWFGGSALFRLDDGKELTDTARVSGCTPNGFAGGGTFLLRSYSCTEGGRLQKLSSGGKAEWTYQAPKGFNVSSIFSADPVVVSLSDKDNKSGGILAIGGDGKVRSQIDLGKETYRPACGLRIMSQKLDGCQGVAASDDMFYLPTEDKKQSGDGFGRYNEIHAFDLDTGQRKWKSAAGNDLTMMPLRTDGGNLIAYQRPTYEKSGRIVSIGAKGGKPKTLMQNPAAARDAENGFYSPFPVYEDGRFYLASDRVTGTSSGSPEKLLLVIGKG